MYFDHFGLNEAPFRITPHTDFFFAGANRGATLEGLIYAVTQDEGIVKVTGEVGSGKTMLCRVLIERMPDTVEVLYLANPSLAQDEILHVLAADLKARPDSERSTILLRAIEHRLIELYAEGRRVVVLIDEAHAMPLETLEQIRLLSNLESNRHKLLQIVLFGQPELDARLAQDNMRQLRERITHSFKLEPLVREDIEHYVDFRMRAAGYRGPSVFAPPALKAIALASQGLTRRINILSDKALMAAFAQGTHQVTARHAQAAIRECDYKRRNYPGWRTAGIAAAVLVFGMGIGATLHRYIPNGTEATVSASASPIALSPPAHPVVVQPSPSASAATQPSRPTQNGIQQDADLEMKSPAGSAQLPSDRTPLTLERFRATQSWLKDAKGYTIHFATVKAEGLGAMEKMLKEVTGVVSADDLHVYRVRIDGRLHFAAAYGLYPDVSSAITAMGELPPVLKARGPFHRSVAVMRRQNSE